MKRNYYFPVILCSLVFCFLPRYIMAQCRTFESTCGMERNTIIWNEKAENNIIYLTTSQNTEVHYYRLAPSLTTLFWQLSDPPKHTNLTIILYNGNYHLKGIFNNQSYSKTVKSKGYPWYQNIAYSAGQTLTCKKSIKYECFRPDNMELYVMQAERKENPTLFNRRNAYEVKVKLTGILSHFWSCLYYFSTENHLFIGYKGVNGGPGTPETVIK